MATSQAQKRATAKYNKEKTKQFSITLNKNNDADIIQFLETIENRQGLIKKLLREEIERASNR